MLRVHGRGFTSAWCAGINGDSSKIASFTVGSRTALTSSATETDQTVWLSSWSVYKAEGPFTQAAATINNGLRWTFWVCFPTLSLSSGESQMVAHVSAFTGATANGNNYFFLYLMVYYDGANYTLQLKRVSATATDYITLDTITAGTTYHRYDLRVFTDKAYTSKDGGTVTETTFTGSAIEGTVWPGNVYLSFYGGEVVPAWDALHMAMEEYDTTTTAGDSRTNGSPDNGVLFLIEKSGLTDLIGTGKCYEISVANGEFTEAATNDKDYLAAKLLSDNDGGFAMKLNKSAGGAWSASNWSRT